MVAVVRLDDNPTQLRIPPTTGAVRGIGLGDPSTADIPKLTDSIYLCSWMRWSLPDLRSATVVAR